MKPVSIAFFLALSTGLFPSIRVHAQANDPQAEHAKLLTVKNRSLIAYFGNGHGFTLEIGAIGAHPAKPSDIPGFITIDKQIVQSTLIPVSKSENLTPNTP